MLRGRVRQAAVLSATWDGCMVCAGCLQQSLAVLQNGLGPLPVHLRHQAPAIAFCQHHLLLSFLHLPPAPRYCRCCSMEPIIGAGRVGKDRRSLLCSICSQPYGACIQCAGSSKCYAAFHPSCARDAGYPMAAVWDEDSSDDEEDAAAPAAGTEQRSSGSKPKNAAAEAAKGKQKGRGTRSSKPRNVRKEGTAAGDNTRLFCFCPKHRSVAGGMTSSLIFQSSVSCSAAPSAGTAAAAAAAAASNSAAGGGSVAAAAAGGARGQEVTSPRRLPSLCAATQQQQQHVESAIGAAAASGAPTAAAAAAGGVPGPGMGVMLFGEAAAAAGSCARSRPADTAVRRGLRAPDALAAALRKRLYVQALPYLVTSSTCAGHLLPPPNCRARLQGPEFNCSIQQQQQPEAQQQLAQQQQQQQVEEQQRHAAQDALQSCFHGSSSRAGLISAAGAAQFGGAVRPSGVLSLADRYDAMNASAAARVCSGKSAIHGLGVFAKVPHKAGE